MLTVFYSQITISFTENLKTTCTFITFANRYTIALNIFHLSTSIILFIFNGMDFFEMYYKLSHYDIRCLDIMYKLGNFLAILPFYNFDKATLVSTTWNKIYAFVFLMIEILCTTWIMYLRITDNTINFFFITFKILGVCDTLILSVLKISLILGIRQSQWMEFNNKFQVIDQKLNIKGRETKKWWTNVCTQFVLGNVLYLTYVIYTLVVRVLEKGAAPLKMFVIHELSGYYSYFTEILICNVAFVFKVRYTFLNDQLSTVGSVENFSVRIQEIGKRFRGLKELVDLFNAIFGLPLVFITGRCILKILASLNFFMSSLQLKNVPSKSSLEVSSVSQTLVALISLSTLILICDSVKSESNKAVFLCYKLQDKFTPKCKKQKELLDVALMIEKHRAIFSAADFFDIDRSTLFAILGTTTTYLIVTFQFNENLK